MNKKTKIFIALSLISLSSIIISPLISLTLSTSLALTALTYLYLQSRRFGNVNKRRSRSLEILIVLPKEPKKFWKFLSLKPCVNKKYGIKIPRRNVVKHVKIYVAALAALPLIITVPLTGTLLPLLLLPMLAIIPCTSIIRQKLSESMRRYRVENELPFFSLLASTLSHAGQTLTKAFNVIADTKIFPALRSEALQLKKEELFTCRDPITAMNNYAQRHSSKLLSSLILGYTSIIKSGGDVTRYLEEKTKELFLMLKDKWNNFVSHVGLIGETMLALFLVMPLMLSMTALIFASEVNIALYELTIFGVIPLLTSMTVYLLHVTRPYESIEYAPNKKAITTSLALTASSVVLSVFVFNQSPLNTVIVTSIAIALPLSINYEMEKVKALEIEKDLPRFLRYLGENKKLGFPILVAIERSSNEQYNKTFRSIIKSALSKMKLGLSFYKSAVILKVRSKLCKIIFFTLDNLIETGGGSPVTFEIMASYLEDYNLQRLRVRRSLYLYLILGYLSPLILAICLHMTTSFMVNAVEPQNLNTLMRGVPTLVVSSLQDKVNLMLFYSELMIIVSSISIGIILGKAIDGTLFSTKHLLICIAVALITLNLLL